jgi:hypothetical protein
MRQVDERPASSLHLTGLMQRHESPIASLYSSSFDHSSEMIDSRLIIAKLLHAKNLWFVMLRIRSDHYI